MGIVNCEWKNGGDKNVAKKNVHNALLSNKKKIELNLPWWSHARRKTLGRNQETVAYHHSSLLKAKKTGGRKPKSEEKYHYARHVSGPKVQREKKSTLNFNRTYYCT